MIEASEQTAYQGQGSQNWEHRFRELLENVHLLAMMLDVEGRLTFCNMYLLQVTEWKAEEVLGGSWFDLFIPAEERNEIHALFAAAVRDDSFPAYHENAIITRSGSRRMVRWNNTFLRGPDGKITGCASIGEDITDTLLLEEQYRRAQKLESVGRLAAGVAHDFNNLLGVIIGNADILQMSLPEGTPASELLEQIQKAGDRAVGLVRQLLTFGGKQAFAPTVFDLDVAVGEVQKMLTRLLKENVAIEHVRSKGPLFVHADRGQVDQVLMNLAVNAGDAMPEGGTLSIALEAETVLPMASSSPLDLPAGEYVALVVRDTGAGIAPEIMPRIFDPFFTTKEPGKGTGLGLATVHGIVKQSRGDVSVESKPGHGATFRIRLPRAQAPTIKQPEGISRRHESKGQGVIMLVEDDPDFRRYVRYTLDRAGYVVLEAEDGNAAEVEFMAHDGRVDLLLSDLVMPKKGGIALAQCLRAKSPNLKVLFMSGYNESGEALQRDPSGFIRKPFRPPELLERIGQALSNCSPGLDAPPTVAFQSQS